MISFADVLRQLEKIPSPGKLLIDGKTAQIDGETHKIDNYDELFRKVLKGLKK